MMLLYQRFQLGGRIEEIEVETNSVSGRQYILLRDVQDVFPTAARFERDGRPVRFQSDERGNRLEPWRIQSHADTTLQVVPAKQMPLAMGSSNGKGSSPSRNSSGGHSSNTTPSAMLHGSGEEEDWREYLLQRAVRMAIIGAVSMLTVLLNHGVSSWLRHGSAFTMVALYWRVVTMALFVLSVVWLLMLVGLVVQVVWFLVNTPIATKRTMYQRLFDF